MIFVRWVWSILCTKLNNRVSFIPLGHVPDSLSPCRSLASSPSPHLTSEVQAEAMDWIWCFTGRVMEEVHSKALFWSIRSRKSCSTHSMTHAQGGVTVAIVIIKKNRMDTKLGSVHEAVLCLDRGRPIKRHGKE